MTRCECGCEVWQKNRKSPKDGDVPPAKEAKDVPRQKEVETKAGRR